jgi:hypothetical protein
MAAERLATSARRLRKSSYKKRDMNLEDMEEEMNTNGGNGHEMERLF